MRVYTVTEKFYKTKAWRRCRESYISKRRLIDGGLCERCGQRIGVDVHHKEYLTEDNLSDPWVSLNHENLELICVECHNIEHGKGTKREMLCWFDENGQPIRKKEDAPY